VQVGRSLRWDLSLSSPSCWHRRPRCLDRLVGRITGRQGLGTGGIEAPASYLFRQSDHALGLAQGDRGVDLHDGGDHLCHCLSELACTPAAPGRCAHHEGDLLGRVMVVIGLPAPLDADMGRDERASPK